MKLRTQRIAANIAAGFQDLADAVRAHQKQPEDEIKALELIANFGNFVALIRGEIASQGRLEERS